MKTILALNLSLCMLASAQSTFVNLDFENATVPYLSNQVGGLVAVSDALPGWTVYRAGVVQSQMPYNGLTAPLSSIGLRSRQFTVQVAPLSYGNFSAFFEPDHRDVVDIAIGQVGTIPADASLLQFYTYINRSAQNLQLSFGGVPLSLQLVSSTASGDLWESDIQTLAGSTGELRISVLPVDTSSPFRLDNIQFTAVPEPGTWVLLGLGAALWFWARGRFR